MGAAFLLVLLTECTDEDLDLVTSEEYGSNFTVDDVYVTINYLLLLLYFIYFSFSLLKDSDESFIPRFIYNQQHIQNCAVCAIV